MTDPLEQDVLRFLAARPAPAAPKADPLEQDVLRFVAARSAPPTPPAPKPALPAPPPRDPILDRLPPTLAADFEKRPEFAAQLAKDRARGLTDDQIVAKIAGGQAVKPKRPAWATNAPSTAEAQPDILFGQPDEDRRAKPLAGGVSVPKAPGVEAATEVAIRAGANLKGTVGALMERTGRKLDLPDPEPKRTPEQEAAMAKMRDIYAVGQPGSPVQQAVTSGIVQPALEAVDREVMTPLADSGAAIQREAAREKEAVPRPKYARDFWEGMKTDRAKTLAIAAGENLPNLALTIGASALAPELGLGVAWAQETGGAYQEAKERGATEEEAQAISGIVGATNMFLEYMPAAEALSKLGGSTRAGIKGFVYDLLEQAVSEGATESLQEANQMLTEAALNAKDQGFTFDEFTKRVGEAGLSAFVLGGATGAVTSGAGRIGRSAEELESTPGTVPDEAPSMSLSASDGPTGGELPLTAQVPRWASSVEDAIARLPEFKQRNRGRVLDKSDLPFDIDQPLPLIRWEDASGAENPRRAGGTFWLLGDGANYQRPSPRDDMSPGGSVPRVVAFQPRNPLITVRPEAPTDVPLGETEGELFARAAAAGHDSVVFLGANIGDVEVVTLPGAELVTREPSERLKNHLQALRDIPPLIDALPREAQELLPYIEYPPVADHRGRSQLDDFAAQYEIDPDIARRLVEFATGHTVRQAPYSGLAEGLGRIPKPANLFSAGISGVREAWQRATTPGSQRDVREFLGQSRPSSMSTLDRRIDPARRKRVAEMTDEEKTAALLTSEATGLPNRRAWEEQAADRPVHIAIDADGLKWVNDRFGHDTGTELLRALGEAIGPLGAYHLQGDEFAMAADTIEEAEARARQIDEALTGVRLRYTAKDGATYEIPIGASYGIGDTYAAADERTLEAKARREASGQRAARGEAPPGLVVFPPGGREAGSSAEGGLNADLDLGREEAGVRPDRPERGPGDADVRLPVRDPAEQGGGRGASLGRQAAQQGADDLRVGVVADADLPEEPGRGVLDGERRAGGPRLLDVQDGTGNRGPGEAGGLDRQGGVATAGDAGASARPDRSLPARVAAKPGEGGFAVVPGAIKKPFMKWWRRRMMATKGLPRYYLDLKVRRDGHLAAKAARLEAYSLDLARAIKAYKGPLTEAQLRVYLDDAYRGMNTTGISGPMDEKQIERITARRQLSEIAQQRLREEGGRGGFPREAREPDMSSLGRKSLREMASRRGLNEDALVSAVRKEGARSAALAPEFPPLLREMRTAQDALERTLRRQGLLDDGSIQQLEREFGLYVHRQYEAPRNPRYLKWIKDQPLWRRAYDLTKSLWDRQAQAGAAEQVVESLGLKRPISPGDFRQGDFVQIKGEESGGWKPRPEGEEELTRAAQKKVPKRPDISEIEATYDGKRRIPPALTFPNPDGSTARFETKKRPSESLAAMKARVRAEAEAALDAAYPEGGDKESLPLGRIGKLVQVNVAGDAGQVEIRNEDGKRETVAVPLRRLEKAFGTRAQAVADVKRTLLDPSTREQFLEEYQIDAETFADAVKEAASANPPMTENEVWGLLQGYMTATGNRPVLPGGVPEGSKDMTALKQRSRMPDLERMLRGEVRSIDWNFFTATLKMATITAQHQFLVELEKAGKGDIFREKKTVENPNTDDEKAYVHQIDPDFYAKSIETAKGREPGIDQDIVKQGSGRSAPLSGLFTTDEILEVLNESFDTKSYPEYLKWYMRAVMTSKAAATAYSWVSATRNVWSQPLMLMGNGVNPFNIPRFLKAGDLAYPLAAGNTSRRRINRMERYIELGIANAGTDLGDIKRMEKAAQVLREDIPKGSGSDKMKAGEGIVYGAGQAGGRALRLTAERARNLYQAPDNQGKIQIFEAQLPLYRKAFPEMTEEQVEEYVAKQMHDTTQTYPMLYPLAQELAAVPFFGSFISFRLEVLRNLYHAMRVAGKEVRSDNPELRKIGLRRVAGLSAAMTLTSAIAGGLRHWLNMDDDDDEAARRFMAPWNKNSEVWFLKKGGDEITFIDASFGDYYAAAKTPFRALLRGDFDGMIDSMKDPFGEDITTEAIIDVLRNQTQEGFDVYNPEDSTLTRAKDIAKHLGAPMTPGTLKSIARVIDPERDTETEMFALFGVRGVTINLPKELRRRVKTYQDRINNGRWIEKKVVRKEGTEEAYDEAQRRSERALRRIVEDMVRDIQAARQLDMDESKITAALLESGIGKGKPEKGQPGEAGMLLAGDVDAVVQRYLNLNEKWGDERRKNFRTPVPHDYPRTSDEVDAKGIPPLRRPTLADIARAKARGERYYQNYYPDGIETEQQTKNRREIGETAKIWQETLRKRGVEQPNGKLFGLGEYFLGEEIRRQDVNQHPDTAMERLGVAGRRAIKEKGPELGRRLAPLAARAEFSRAERYLLDSFTTESTDRMTEIMVKMRALWDKGQRGKQLWDQIRPMLDYKAQPGE